MEEQLVQAVEIASDPQSAPDPSLPQQALQYLEHLKAITHESWNPGWAVWAARTDSASGPKYGFNARLFGLNLVDDFLENRTAQSADPASAVSFLQEAALSYIQSEYVAGNAEGGLTFLKNKFAQTLTLLLLQTYSLPASSTLLSTLLTLFRAHPPGSPSSSVNGAQQPLNSCTTDLLLRLLHDLSVTLGSDATLRAVRSKERLQRDGMIRDEIRANTAPSIADCVWQVVEEGLQKVDAGRGDGQGSRQWSYKTAVELTEGAVRVVGDYVSWIDISLMVTPRTVPLLFSLLHHGAASLRLAAADTLLEITSKGMKPADKLELLRVLNLTEVLAALENRTRDADGKGKGANGLASGDDNVDFRERLAKLANGVAMELCKIVEETAAEEETRQTAESMLGQHLPLILAFLADEYDEPAEQVLQCINQVLGIYKKSKKRNPTNHLTPVKSEFLTNLIRVVLQKMKYDEEAEWSGAGAGAGSDDGDLEDDEAHFAELRRNLQTIMAAIATIEENLFSTTVHALVLSTLASFEASAAGAGPQIDWQQAELSLFVIYFYGETLSTASGLSKTGLNANSFVVLPDPEPGKSAKKALAPSVYPTLPLSSLGEMMQRLVRSNVSAYPHPAVQLQFFESVVRYSSFFIVRPECISDTLAAFLDWRGLHHERIGVRHRANYLFYRFVRETKAAIPPDFVQRLLEGMQDLLMVQAELPSLPPDEDPLAKGVEAGTAFEAQLNLFDTAGTLISLLSAGQASQLASNQLVLLKAVVDPLSEQLRQAVQAFASDSTNLQLVLQAHHLILAVASVAKGFPDLTVGAVEPPWVSVFKGVTEQILTVLGTLNGFSIIRDAARGAFARIVQKTGVSILPYIPNLINALLNEVSASELSDFAHFLGQIVVKYSEHLRPVLDELFLPLVEKMFFFLNQPVAGTDDVVQRNDLQKAYINLLNHMVQHGLDQVLVSEKNQPQLESVLQSLTYYSTTSDVANQRAAFGVLARLVSLWGGAGAAASRALPGFERFIYETLVALVFEAPAKSTFDLKDAQSQMVLSEIAGLFKTMYEKRGQELITYLATVYLPSIQCPPDLSEELTRNLQSQEAKPFKRTLEAFIVRSRGG